MDQLSISIEAASKLTGIGRTKLYQAMKQGALKAKKFGKRTIILKEDLNSFLSNLDTYSVGNDSKNG